ncbi:MAG: hypothetical protein L6275_01080 [Candidatus Portnoybacteria bacterium]|nr:hypothetical protein [Candidatus Portnoybacteria bacterium]
MSNFLLKHKKVIASLSLILAVSAFGIFIFGAGEARAADSFLGKVKEVVWDTPTDYWGGLAAEAAFDAVAWMLVKLGAIIKSIVGLFFFVASMLLEMAFGLEKFTNAGVVQIGWKITRDVANMLFVIGLIIIAGATALKIESYDVKKLLPKLIIAALLINFSLVIGGVIIDFTQVATHFFYEEINVGKGLTEQIAGTLKVSKMPEINASADMAEKLAKGISGIILLLFSIIMETILILAASIAIVIGAFFMIVRMIHLWILLILAPMAWAMSVLPATEHLFKKWWTDFLKWSFFAPVYAFFIYLAVKAGTSGAILDSAVKDVVLASGWKETIGSALFAAPDLLMQFLVVIGLLFGGVIVAQKLGVYGAQGVMDIGKAAQKGAGNWAKRKALSASARPAGWAGEKLSAAAERMGWVGRASGIKSAARQGGRGFRSLQEMERAATGKEKEKYKGYTTDNLQRASMAVDGRAKVAIAQLLAEKREFKENEKTGYTQEEIQKAIKIAQRHGQEGDLLSARPDIAASMAFNAAPLGKKQEAADAALEKYISFTKDGLSKIQSESLGGNSPNSGQAAVQGFIKKSITEKRGKMNPSTLSKLHKNNPALSNHITEKAIKPIYQDEAKKKKLKGDRPDTANYVESSAGKALGIV